MSLVTFPAYAPVQIVTDRFARKKASRVTFGELRKAGLWPFTLRSRSHRLAVPWSLVWLLLCRFPAMTC